MTCSCGVRKVHSYNIENIISGFWFDINTKWRVKPNNSLLFLFRLLLITICLWDGTLNFTDNWVILKLLGMFLLIYQIWLRWTIRWTFFFYQCRDLLKDAGCVIWIFMDVEHFIIRFVVRLKKRIIQAEGNIQVIDYFHFMLHWIFISNLFSPNIFLYAFPYFSVSLFFWYNFMI